MADELNKAEEQFLKGLLEKHGFKNTHIAGEDQDIVVGTSTDRRGKIENAEVTLYGGAHIFTNGGSNGQAPEEREMNKDIAEFKRQEFLEAEMKKHGFTDFRMAGEDQDIAVGTRTVNGRREEIQIGSDRANIMINGSSNGQSQEEKQITADLAKYNSDHAHDVGVKDSASLRATKLGTGFY